MNHTARPDGALCVERPPADRLPNVVALSNRGDAAGEVRGRRRAVAARDPTTCPPWTRPGCGRSARRTASPSTPTSPTTSPSTAPTSAATRPRSIGPRLRSLEPLAVVRPDDAAPRRLRFGAWQNEFLREFLLGPESTAELMQPGTGWTTPPAERVEWLAERLRHAHDLVRQWGVGADRGWASPPVSELEGSACELAEHASRSSAAERRGDVAGRRAGVLRRAGLVVARARAATSRTSRCAPRTTTSSRPGPRSRTSTPSR